MALLHPDPGRADVSLPPDSLVADPFDYRVTRRGAVIVSRGGRAVLTLGGRDAARLVAVLQRADDLQAQYLLARASADAHGDDDVVAEASRTRSRTLPERKVTIG